MLIKVYHLRQAKMCNKGARDFFKRHGMDWKKFAREGLDESEFLATGDAMAARLVEVAHNGR